MTYFKQALSSPEHHFSRLGTAKPLFLNGQPKISRTLCGIETEIEWNGRRYLLMLPLREEFLRHIEELEIQSRERSRGPIIENLILYNELTIRDALGHTHSFSVILQEISCGVTLKEAVFQYKAEDLTCAVEKMKQRLDALGFLHKNLRPSNILICKSGTARPLRYWYAEWFDFTDNDVDESLDFIRKHADFGMQPLHPADIAAESYEIECDGIRRVCRQGKYGFVDYDGRLVAPYIYSSATPFREGRAVVGKNGKMGAIDHYGAKVIPVIYKTLDFDIETGTFTATNDSYCYTIDYEGKIIRREKFEGGGFLIAENGNQK